MSQILVVSDQKEEREWLCLTLRRQGHDVEAARRGDDAVAFAREGSFDLVVSDANVPGSSSIELLRELKQLSPEPQVVLMSAQDSVEEAVQAMRHGADDYLCKPIGPDSLARFLKGAGPSSPSCRTNATSAVPRVAERAGTTPDSSNPFARIVGGSIAIRELLDLVRKVARTDSTVLVTGETGTGKELIGSAIHAASGRSERVFSAVNSATFPETLLESELFGHRRGSFTGASANKKGLFEHAHRGTVFLDEVAEMPLSMQAKLLRFLQTGEIRPVGSETSRVVDVRLVAATNKNLEREVAEGRFREDLYYRLAVIPIEIPPLRERSEDIPALAGHFLRRVESKLGKRVHEIEADAMEVMLEYAWPGNVRELENWIERSAALCRGGRISLADLPRRFRERSALPENGRLESLQTLERSHILNTLERVGWNRKRAAEILQISTTTLWRRLKQFGIEGPVASARRF